MIKVAKSAARATSAHHQPCKNPATPNTELQAATHGYYSRQLLAPYDGDTFLFIRGASETALVMNDPVAALAAHRGELKLMVLEMVIFGAADGAGIAPLRAASAPATLLAAGRAASVGATANRLQHLRAVADFIAHPEAGGFQVIGREVTVRTPFGRRVLDVVLRNPQTGAIGGVEIKSSVGAFNRFDPAARQQFAADRWINWHGGRAVGAYNGLPSMDGAVNVEQAQTILESALRASLAGVGFWRSGVLTFSRKLGDAKGSLTLACRVDPLGVAWFAGNVTLRFEALDRLFGDETSGGTTSSVHAAAFA